MTITLVSANSTLGPTQQGPAKPTAPKPQGGAKPVTAASLTQGDHHVSSTKSEKTAAQAKKEAVVDQIKLDSGVTAAETACIKTSVAITRVSEQANHLKGASLVMNYIGEAPIMAGRSLSYIASGFYAKISRVAPGPTKVLTDATHTIQQGVTTATKGLRKEFPTASRLVTRSIPYAAVMSSSGFAIYDTYNARELIYNPKASKETKAYAIATAGISYVSVGAVGALTLAPRFGAKAPVIAAVAGGVSMLTFGASIVTSVGMEWSKQKDGIN